MADNTTLNPGSGGDVTRAKDRTGIKTQVVCLDINPGGSESLMAGVMPVNDNGGSLTVDGAVSVSGTITANAGSGTLAVSLASLPALAAGTNLIGQASGSDETGTLYNGTTALTPKFAIITASSSGATTVVAAVSSKKLRVLRWRASANGNVNIKFQSHVTPTDISGLSYCTQYKDVGGGYCPLGHFQTVAGEALDINLSGSVAVSGELTYVEV
jgi:hypothetical protein